MPFTACAHAPGCLPDTTEPLPVFDSTEQAWAYLAEEFERYADDMSDELFLSVHTEIHNQGGAIGTVYAPDGLCYSVEVAEEKGN